MGVSLDGGESLMTNHNLNNLLTELNDQEYAQLLTAASRFLQDLDHRSFDEAISNTDTVSDAVLAMAVHYFVKEMVPIPVEDIGMAKIERAAAGSAEKRKELLTLYLGTSLLGYQNTGQFAGLSFGATEKELFATYAIIKAFYDLDNPHRPSAEAGRVFFWPKRSLEEKLKAIVIKRGLNQPG